ncbi:MAG: pyridoxamine 5'-phosphate oxidase family protein [Acidimicrobiales bacterium]
MRETPEDLGRLQQLLDRSYDTAGAHLLEVITPERRLTAGELVAQLQDMRLLVLATVTGDGRPVTGPVDGFFFRGSFYFGSSPESIRFQHIRQRPWVSACHLPGEELSVSVHGRAEIIDLNAPEHGDFRQTLLDYYLPRWPEWEQVIEKGACFARIDATRMYTFYMPAT